MLSILNNNENNTNDTNDDNNNDNNNTQNKPTCYNAHTWRPPTLLYRKYELR